MKTRYFPLILLFMLQVSCGQLNVTSSCNCDSEKKVMADLEAELAKLKKQQNKIAINISKNKTPQYGLLTKTNWKEIDQKLLQDKVQTSLAGMDLWMRRANQKR